MLRGLLLFALLVSCGGKKQLLTPELGKFPRTIKYSIDYTLFKVSNDLTVAFVPQPKANLVSVDVRYSVGATEDPRGKEGLAHFVEHLLFEVRAHQGAPTIAERLAESGLSSNAYTTFDETHYTATAAADQLIPLLGIEADRMNATCADIDDELLERERQVVKRERAQRASSSGDLARELQSSIFGSNHPYDRSVAGTDASIDAITKEDVCAFIDAHYGPTRAFLVVSGRFDMKQMRPVVGRIFSRVATRATGAQTALQMSRFPARTSKHRVAIENPALVVAFPSPKWGTRDYIEERLAVGLLVNQLKAELEDKEVTGVYRGYLGGYRGGANLIMLDLTKTATPSKVADKIFAVASKFSESAKNLDIDQYKVFFREAAVGDLEAFGDRARTVADYLQYTSHYRFILEDLDRVDAITEERLISRGAGLTRSRAHVAVLEPDNKARKREVVQLAAGREFDLDIWRSPVDPTTADRPMGQVAKRPERTIKRFELENGLRVVLASNFTYPTVDFRFVIPIGSEDEPEDQPGIAQFSAETLSDDYFAIYKMRGGYQVLRALELGGGVTGSAGRNYTMFSVRGLAIFADALLYQLYLRLESGKHFARDADFQAAAKRMAEQQNSLLVAAGALLGNQQTSPWSADNKGLSKLRKAATRFRKEHYRAQGSTLVITGRFDVAEMEQRVARLFDSKSREPPKPTVKRVAATPSARAFSIIDEDKVQPSILLGFRLPAGFQTDRAKRLVLEELLTQRLTSIRERLGATYGISVGLATGRGPGLLLVSGDVEDARAAEVMKSILVEIRTVADLKDVKADFVRARRLVFQRLLADSADARSTANELSLIAAYDLPERFFALQAEKVAALTVDALAPVARQLGDDSRVIVLRGKSATLKEMFAAAGVKTVKEIK